MTRDDLYTLLGAEESFNDAYNSDIITEFPFNAYGILEKVTDTYGREGAKSDGL